MTKSKTVMVETRLKIPVTARFDGEMCDHWCDHIKPRQNRSNIPMFRCDHFGVNLLKVETQDERIYALRCPMCVKLFGGA